MLGRMCRLAAFAIVGLLVVSSTVLAQDESWEFEDVGKIRLELVSGSITVQEGSGDKVRIELESETWPARTFRADVEQDGRTVYIEEHWRGNTRRANVEWTLYLPKTEKPVRIRGNTASGGLVANDVTAEFRFNTASGNVELTDVVAVDGSEFNTASGDILLESMRLTEDCEFNTASGDVELDRVTVDHSCQLNTASGDVRCRESKGEFELNTASGDVSFRTSTITGPSKFASASGDVYVEFEKLPEHDIEASTASGRVEFSCNDFGENFTLVMVKGERRGRVTCPFDYTSEDYFEEWDTEYEEKVVEKGTGKPEIYLRTASGSVIVEN